jgi:hypothetical protein
MFLHELSRKVSQKWAIKVDSQEYEELARKVFDNRCPYCSCDLSSTAAVIEHLDGMNRYRVGLHVPGNVLVACKRCNGEKRRDDSLKALSLAPSGWESFLSHDGSRCDSSCSTCAYWKRIWIEDGERRARLNENLERLRAFRRSFPEFGEAFPSLSLALPVLLTKVYSDCQAFAAAEIKSLLERVDSMSAPAK